MTHDNRLVPKRIGGIIFDYDGVLLPLWPRAWEILPEIFRHLGLQALETSIERGAFRNNIQKESMGRVLFDIIPDACARRGLRPPSKEEVIAILRTHETTVGDPIPLSDATWNMLRILRAWRMDPAHPLRFMGIVSDRTYTSAWHHMNGAQQELFSLIDVMQFSRVQKEERAKEELHAQQQSLSCDIRIQSHRKPEAEPFQHFVLWLQEKDHLKQATAADPLVALYVGDTLLDARGAENANRAFRENGVPFRLFFVPACLQGPVLTHDEWKNIIGTPPWASDPVSTINDLLWLAHNYSLGGKNLPPL